MKGHPTEGEWLAWLDAGAPADEARLESHLAGCPECGAIVAELSHALLKADARGSAAAAFSRVRSSLMDALPERLERAAARERVERVLGKGFAEKYPGGVPAALGTLLGAQQDSRWLRSLPDALLAAAGAYTLLTAAAWALWMSSGDWAYMHAVFSASYPTFLVFFAATETALALLAARHFAPGQPLRAAWSLIVVSAACRTAGLALRNLGVLDRGLASPALDAAGQFISGPAALLALGAGLHQVMGQYRSLGLKVRLRWTDYALLGVGGAAFLRHLIEIAWVLAKWGGAGGLTILNWLSDPALLFVLAIAVPLRRVAKSHGGGLITRCWASIAAGVLLTLLGNVLIYFENYGLLLWPWNSVIWLVWLPASAAFALGPACQLAASAQLVGAPVLAEEAR